MSDKMRFVTFFPQGENVHLIKDVGQIPFYLHKYYGVDAVLVSNGISGEGPYIAETKGLKFSNTTGIWGRGKIGEYLYLFFHARKIDWLNLYHYSGKSLMRARIYKLANPKGKIYLKLDVGFEPCNLIINNSKERKFFIECVKHADIVSAETSSAIQRLQPYSPKKIISIPNGFMLDERQRDFGRKENVFLTVGRLGTREKATEVLLEAYAACAEKIDWNLELVGTIEKNFIPYIKNYFDKHPELKSRVKFLGEISDRRQLADIYQRARVFVLPSRWESFGLVLPEAASQGCKLLLTSSVSSCADFVVDEHYGRIVEPDNVEQLAATMREMAGEIYDMREAMKIRERTLEQFSWGKIIEKLYQCMMEVEMH